MLAAVIARLRWMMAAEKTSAALKSLLLLLPPK
jgi:hypothetical protein